MSPYINALGVSIIATSFPSKASISQGNNSALVDTVRDDALWGGMYTCCLLPSAYPLALIRPQRLCFNKII